MVFYLIRMRWTEFIWVNQFSARFRKPFLVPLMCWGVFAPPLYLFLLPFYSRFLPPEWGPQGWCLSHPPLPPVVGSGCKDKKVWPCQAQGHEHNNGSLFPRPLPFLRYPFLLQYFSCSVVRHSVSLQVAGCRLYPRLYPC